MKLKTRFTRWYVRRGYEFGYTNYFEAYYICPVWVKPLLPFLFSPSVYLVEKWKNWSSELSKTAAKFAIPFSELTKAASRITERSNTDNATQSEKQ